MSEPYLPLPDPERNDYWQESPLRCSVPGCRQILGSVNPASIKEGMEGICPTHGRVSGHYFDSRSFGNPEGE